MRGPQAQFKEDQPKIFSATDVTYLDGKLFVVTGYCPGDFVLTLEESGGKWAWGSTAWGGKGTEPGKFQTAHGVTAFEGHIYVSNREAHAVNKFTPDGNLVEILPGIPVPMALFPFWRSLRGGLSTAFCQRRVLCSGICLGIVFIGVPSMVFYVL